MKKAEIKIGETYLAKVTNKVVPVRIDAEHASGGWTATNLATSKTVRIKSAQRLHRQTASAEHLKAVHKADQENARLAEERAQSTHGMTASERAMAESAPRAKRTAKATSAARPTPKRDTGKRDASGGKTGGKTGRKSGGGGRGLSLIDAAVQVLAKSKEPLNTTAMVEQVTTAGLWTPGAGKTPHATLYSAILREIKLKGDAARFVKVERGQFTLASGMKKGA
jgi:hypothetical protein